MDTNWNLEETQVLLYLSNKSNEFQELQDLALKALSSWQHDDSVNAQKVVIYLLQNSSPIASSLLLKITQQLENYSDDDEANLRVVDANLSLLELCAKPKSSNAGLMSRLWHIIGTTENSARAEQTSHVIALLLPSYETSPLHLTNWWQAIIACMSRTAEKRQLMAALRAWLACVCHEACTNDIQNVVNSDGATYFRLLEPRVGEASKFALQILESTFQKVVEPINNDFMVYDPRDNGMREAWSRYISLIEVLGVDTSVHQTMGSLPDFAALLGENSPISPRWIISLVNVGLCVSNTEGIRVLTMELVMSLTPKQLKALTLFPDYVSGVFFPRMLQTPNFVVIYDSCIHADHFERFSRNILIAYLEESLESLQKLITGIATYFMEHSHCFEAPRVLFTQAMLDILPRGSLPTDVLNRLQIAAEATSATYNSKAIADLNLELVKKLVDKINVEPPSDDVAIKFRRGMLEQAHMELLSTGAFSRETFIYLKSQDIKFKEEFIKFQPVRSPRTLNESTLNLQASFLDDTNYIPVNAIADMLDEELNNPCAMNAIDRNRLSDTVELGFDFVHSTTFDLCEITFSAFSSVPTRLAALRAFKRCQPTNIPLDSIKLLWGHLKDATLRFIDRELHHEFIELITTPGAIAEPPQDICIELVDLSVRRRNLLTPMAIGLFRFAKSPFRQPWVNIVMARIFAFMRSPEYTVRFEEIVANRYGIYEEKWGHPEAYARVIAAIFLKQYTDNSSADAILQDTLGKANLNKQITGSLDNPEAHLRVLYYQILILVQEHCTHELAMDTLRKVTSSLEMEANPPVRMHAEWLVGLLASTHIGNIDGDFNEFVMSKIDELDGGSGTPPRVLSSLIRICLLLYYMQFSKSSQDAKEIGKFFVDHLLPLATSNKAVLRHRSISALYIISEKNMVPPELKSIVDTCARINTAAVVSSTFQNESYLWNLTDTRLGPVCGGICSAVFDKYMPQTLLDADFDAVRKIKELEVSEVVVGPCWSPQSIVNKRRSELPLPDLIEAREKVVADAVKQGLTAEFSTSMQTKSGNFDVEYHARRTELIVVATLCDKPVNLGAICRLSDALGAKSMTIKDTSVLTDQHFKSTALTAEKWIPIEQVSELDLGEYLLTKKSEGYTLIGIEQTDTSKTLGPTLRFPKKTLLMMGHEKQGIPAELLALLDSCIEIEQLGYVRSMNIQTATAIVVHAYNHQHGEDVRRLEYAKTSD